MGSPSKNDLTGPGVSGSGGRTKQVPVGLDQAPVIHSSQHKDGDILSACTCNHGASNHAVVTETPNETLALVDDIISAKNSTDDLDDHTHHLRISVNGTDTDDIICENGGATSAPLPIPTSNRSSHNGTAHMCMYSAPASPSLHSLKFGTSYQYNGNEDISLHGPRYSVSSPEEECSPFNYPLVTAHYASDADSDVDPYSDEDKDDEVWLPSTIDSDENETPANSTDYNSFWQYKKLPKGPKPRKTYRIDATQPKHDPHSPITFKDPIFDKSQKLDMRHFGKARLGDGNDVSPNPEKLVLLGKDVERITEKMATIGDNARKEKMKLSSRLCRIKRSANHEANKIKLAGLEQEREELSSVINMFRRKVKSGVPQEHSLAEELEMLKEQRLKTKVAGRTSAFVNDRLSQTDYTYDGDDCY